MTLRNILLLLVAIVAAAGTAILARGWINAERAAFLASVPAPEAAAPSHLVLVAKDTLTAGTFVKEKHLKWQAWPEDGLSEDYVLKGKRPIKEFVGAVVRNELTAGQPLTDKRVVQPGDRGFLAAVLTPGMRAVSVPVNATTGISGFVFPGDWVDVVLTIRTRTENEGGNSDTRYLSQTLLNKVRVLAVDQTIENDDGKASVAKTATVEVTTKQVEKVALALEMGSLSLSLRSLARDEEDGDSPVEAAIAKRRVNFTLDNELNVLRNQFGNGSKSQVNVVRGSKAEKAVF